MSKSKIISPIAIDLGAKNTGVYFAHYEANTPIEDIDKDGKVYQLEKDNYTLLMARRTATRHQRRGFDRRQMVKRLFKLIWKKHFGLKWDENVQQTTSFLFNRRGFSFLTEEYDPDILKQFPKEAYEELPEELKELAPSHQNGEYDFDKVLEELSDKKEGIEKIYEGIKKKTKVVNEWINFIGEGDNSGEIGKLRKYCKDKLQEDCIKRLKKDCMDKLRQGNNSNTSQVDFMFMNKKKLEKLLKKLEELLEEGVQDAEEHKEEFEIIYEKLKELLERGVLIVEEYKEEFEKIHKKLEGLLERGELTIPNSRKSGDLSEEQAQAILDNFPDYQVGISTINGITTRAKKIFCSSVNYKESRKKLKESDWNFKPPNFEPEDFDNPKKDKNQTHLRHLAFALYKIYDAHVTGARPRKDYFDNEVKKVLEKRDHEHPYLYLKDFCTKLNGGEFKKLNSENLTNLIGHLSNLELKPLRKYFNDKKHKQDDYWDEQRLEKIFDHWIMKQWRVGEKDEHKLVGADYDYKVLRRKWDGHKDKYPGAVIKFCLELDPQWTIPPYQDINNRRPPRCQSLILNTKYLDAKYPDWKEWLKYIEDIQDAKDSPSVETYLKEYKKKLQELKSSSDRSYFIDDESCNKKSKYNIRTQDDLNARLLQFILDRTKDSDPLKLNDIFSHTKKYHQEAIKLFQEEYSDEEKQKADDEKKAIKTDIKKSRLPQELLEATPRDYKDEEDIDKPVFEEGTFLHFVNRYYKLRQRARDGRLYIHPEYSDPKERGYENTGRYADAKCLLTYCNHKPRQKRYQMLEDVAALFRISAQDLSEIIGVQEKDKADKKCDKLSNWLSNIECNSNNEGRSKSLKLKKVSEDAAKEQKKRRGYLRFDVQSLGIKQGLTEKEFKEIYKSKTILRLEAREKKPTNQEIKEIVDDGYRLYKLCEDAKKLNIQISEEIGSPDDDLKERLKENPASAIYLLAQIHNIVFLERSGNSKTCSVCSTDNAQRMQMVSGNESESHAKASRLPAIATRVIDGAVMRMARIVGSAIAKDKWKKIEKELEEGKSVCVPIITEQNRFEFEPSLRVLKGKEGDELEDKVKVAITDQEQRIKAAGNGICPYTGEDIGPDSGQIDHILPRKSQWGTLNDEANLIWASCIGNQHKSNKPVAISDLNSRYMEKQYPEKSYDEIKDEIYTTINGKGDSFKFGRYMSFINLTADQQKAFRHALFLEEGDELRDKVIKAISNRNRAFVNGTQRYFAETIANSLYKEALRKEYKEEKLSDLLSFDYFEVNSMDVSQTRKYLRDKKNEGGSLVHPEIGDHDKGNEKPILSDMKRRATAEIGDHDKGNEKQSEYSHLIDAQLAFLIAASNHCKEGSITKSFVTPYEFYDKNGEVRDPYGVIKIDVGSFNKNEGKLSRTPIKYDQTKGFSHRPLFNDNPGAWHFLHLIEIEIDKNYYLKGFLDLAALKACLNEEDFAKAISEKYSYKENDKEYPLGKLLKDKEKEDLLELYRTGKGKYEFGYKTPKVIMDKYKSGGNNVTIRIYHLDKTKIAEFLLENFNTQSDPNQWSDEDCQVLDRLASLWYFTKRKELLVKEGSGKVKLEDWKVEDLKFQKFLDPSLLQAWLDLSKEWQEKLAKDPDEKYIREFLENFFTNTKGKKENREEDKKTDKNRPPHQKVRKVFSLPSASGQGWFLVRRKNKIQDKFIYQCLSESNDISKFVKNKEDKKVLVAQYRQSSLFLFPKTGKKSEHLKEHLSPLENIVDREKWKEIEMNELYKDENILKIAKNKLNKIEKKLGTDVSRSRFRLTFKEKPDFDIDFIKLTQFSKRRQKKVKVENIKEFISCIADSDLTQWHDDLKKRIDKLKEEKSRNDEQKKELKYLEKLDKIYKIFQKHHSELQGNTLELQKN